MESNLSEAMLMDQRGRREARTMEQVGKNKPGMGLEGQVQRMRGRRASVWARAVGQGSGGGGSWGRRGGTGGFPATEVSEGPGRSGLVSGWLVGLHLRYRN